MQNQLSNITTKLSSNASHCHKVIDELLASGKVKGWDAFFLRSMQGKKLSSKQREILAGIEAKVSNQHEYQQ